jgi:hypothetical protein
VQIEAIALFSNDAHKLTPQIANGNIQHHSSFSSSFKAKLIQPQTSYLVAA